MSYLHTAHIERIEDMRIVHNASDLRAAGEAVPEAIFGDTVGGKSFTNEEAARLEAASAIRRDGVGHGWREMWYAGACWTLIDCTPATDRERREYAEALAM